MTDEFTPRAATAAEARQLRAAGFYTWGFGSWIHEGAGGDVLTTDQALAMLRTQLEEAVDAFWGG